MANILKKRGSIFVMGLILGYMSLASSSMRMALVVLLRGAHMKQVQFLAAALIATLGFSFLTAAPVRADESEQFFCAAVLPCNSDGTVQAPFDQGLCAPTYRSQCLSMLANKLQESGATCDESLDRVAKKAKRLARQLRKFKAARR